MFREKLDSTRETLLEARDHLALLDIEVVLRDPFDEEIDEIRSWLQEMPPIA